MKAFSLLILFLVFSAVLPAQNTKQLVTPDDLNDWVSYLASDEMRGRRNGSPEMEEAAKWLASKFREFGVQEYKDYPAYIQEYSFNTRSGTSVDERNVIGYIEGSDPELKDEYIIVSAHFDHIGVRGGVEGDSIYNGADDNAAGTSSLLGVAKYLKISGKTPGRTLIFALVSGEEMGLHGSRYIAKNPTVDLKDIYVNINFEMTGHSEELGKGSYYMTGCSYSNLDELVQEFGKDSPITLVDTIAIADRLFFMSDNLSFSRIKQEGDLMYGIPSGTFVTSSFAPHVHSPIDEVKLFDLDNMAKLVNYFSEMIIWLSYSKEPVVWTDERFKRIN